MGCFGFGKSQVKEPLLIPFTNFVLKVDPTGAWESTVAKVLKKTKLEVSNFRMHDDGMLQMSGTLDPVLLLKVLAKSGKAAQLVGWKYGGCSRNLHMPEFEQYQQYKQYHQYLTQLQAYYDDAYHRTHRHGGGRHGPRNYAHNYGYPRYNNAQYLPYGQHHPHTHDPRY